MTAATVRTVEWVSLEGSRYPLKGRRNPWGMGVKANERSDATEQDYVPEVDRPRTGEERDTLRLAPPIGRPHNEQVCPRGHTNRPAVPYSLGCVEGRPSRNFALRAFSQRVSVWFNSYRMMPTGGSTEKLTRPIVPAWRRAPVNVNAPRCQ